MQEFEKRKEAFITAYGEIREKYQCDFMSYPQFIPNGEQRDWKVVIAADIVDLSSLSVPSPFVKV